MGNLVAPPILKIYYKHRSLKENLGSGVNCGFKERNQGLDTSDNDF